MDKNIDAALAELERTEKKVSGLLKEWPNIAQTLSKQFGDMANILSMKGEGQIVSMPGAAKIETITTLKGKPFDGSKVAPTATATVAEPIKTAEQAQLKELLLEVEKVEPVFSEMPNDKILDEVSDLAIRAIAKKANMPVTETNPAKIDTKYIQLIKDTLKK